MSEMERGKRGNDRETPEGKKKERIKSLWSFFGEVFLYLKRGGKE